MDIQQAFPVVTERIQKLETAELATRIVGFLLLHYGEEEIIRLALCPDQAIEKVVDFVKTQLARRETIPLNLPILQSLTPKPVLNILPQFNHLSLPGFSSPIAVDRPMPKWDELVLPDQKLSYHDALSEIRYRTSHLGLVDNFDQGAGRLSENFVEDVRKRDTGNKLCKFFIKGSCKMGNNCRFIHELPSPVSVTPFDYGINQFPVDEQLVTGSLERLEIEIVDLLKMHGRPIQIASLPVVYFTIYCKPLQANGYQIESPRNGNLGYGLMKLLGGMNSILCTNDRPNGQPSIILAKDAPKHLDYRTGRNSPGPIVNKSQEIYLKFPKESSFTKEDVAEYFSKFGEVEDVIFPRMYGYVTFSNPETVDDILSTRTPHLVRGFEVLVKPCREKSKLPDRRNTERLVSYPHRYADSDSESISTPRERLADIELLWKEQQMQMEQYMDRHHMDFQFERGDAELPRASHRDYFPASTYSSFFTVDATNNRTLDSTQESFLPDSLTSLPFLQWNDHHLR